MLKQPISRYRPTRSPTAAGGGSVESYGAPSTIYGTVEIHKAETKLDYDHQEDVKVRDVLGINESGRNVAYYRVVEIIRQLGARTASATLERLSKPIEPS
jgi:hypothetical protein